MSFNFGTGQSMFGSTPTKPTGFGTAFSTPTTTTAATGFSLGTGFGNTTAQPAFGVAPQASAFGTTTQASAFGTTATPAAFGATATPAPLFGATQTPTAFGTTATSTAQPSLFGTPTTKSSLFGAPATGGLFSTPQTGTNLFGTTTTQAPLFGGLSTSTTPSLFGTATTTPSLFGTGFGTSTGTTGLFSSTGTGTGFGGFGSNTFGTSLFGQKPPEQPANTTDNQLQQTLASFYAVNIFSDERDDIIKKWNMLQASWGTGKGYYGPNQQVQYNTSNPMYRFKAVGYNLILKADNCEGLVKMIFNKKEAELNAQKDSLIAGIAGILGNKPNLTVMIFDIRAVADNQVEVKIVVSEKGVAGTSRKIPASDLANYLNQPGPKQQLANVGVTFICPYVTPNKSELEEYLSKRPPGIDAQMWEAARADNPDPSRFMPVGINGFSDLKTRMLNQERETGLHMAFLQKVDKDIAELKKKHAASMAQITGLKQKFLELQHRILRVLVKQECTRKVGYTIQQEEEVLKGRLETLNAHLNTPTQFKGQLIELMSCVKTIGNFGRQYNEHYQIDPQVQEDIKQFLSMEQSGITHLINIINEDLEALKIISSGTEKFLVNKTFATN